MKTKILKIARYTTKQDGTPLVTKEGKAYTSVRIQTNETGANWASGFENQLTQGWKAGDEVEIVIEKKGQYLNFSTPKRESVSNDKLDKILVELGFVNNKLDQVIKHLSGVDPLDRTSDGSPMPKF